MAKSLPLYAKVIEKLKERIRTGDFEYSTPFATEDRITKEYGVSRITAIRALDEMEKMGLIFRKRGSGSFVTENCAEMLGGDEDNSAEPLFIKKNKEAALIALVLPFDVKLGGMMQCFNGINDFLNRGNCFIQIYNTNHKTENEAEILKGLLENDIDGVICYPEKDNSNLEIFNQFLTKNVPLVLIDRHIENMPISYVVPDNFNGARQLCEYALSKGHKRIGFFSLSKFSGICSLRERYMGYAMTMNDSGGGVNLDDVIIGDTRMFPEKNFQKNRGTYMEYIKYVIGELISNNVTAVICQNDWVARDVIRCCDEMGVDVPEEMLVMGFDHLNAFQKIDVGERITTVEQNFYEIGKKAGEVILKELQYREGKCIRTVVPVKLVKGKAKKTYSAV